MRRYLKFIRILLLSIILWISGCSNGARDKTVFYVSCQGNDSWSGKLSEPNTNKTDGPFATFEKAREAVRSLKKSGPLPVGGITVDIREGIYPVSGTFNLGAEDSGTESAPVVWRAFSGEKVQLAGGKEVTGFVPIEDPSVIKRIHEIHRDRILMADLKAQGIFDYGEITRRGAPGMELFFNDMRMTLARWPNEGWVKIADVPQTGKLVFKGGLPHMRHGIPAGRHYGRFTYEGDRPNRWSDVKELFLHGYWVWDWYDEFLKVKSIDTQKHEIVIQEPLISLENTEYITIQGINLEFSRGSAVSVMGGTQSHPRCASFGDSSRWKRAYYRV